MRGVRAEPEIFATKIVGSALKCTSPILKL